MKSMYETPMNNSMYPIDYWFKHVNNEIDIEAFVRGQQSFIPSTISTIFTRECNLACQHCVYDFPDEKDISSECQENIVNAVGAIRKEGVSNLIHIGRKLKPEDITALKHFMDEGISLELIDNGSVGSYITKLTSLGVFFENGINISIDGDQKHHEMQRGQGTWKLAINNIEKLSYITNRVFINSTLTKINCESIISGTQKVFENYDIVKGVSYSITHDPYHINEKMHPDPQQLKLFLSSALQMASQNISLNIFYPDDLEQIIRILGIKGMPKRNYSSIEWNVGNISVNFFPPSIASCEEFLIDVNGNHLAPFSIEKNMSKLNALEHNHFEDLLKSPVKSHQSLFAKFFSNKGKNYLQAEIKLLKEILH